MHGLLFKNVPATGAQKVQGFLLNTCAYTRPFQILQGLLFKIVPATDPKQRVSCELFGAHHASI
jgi:hypothetical protein